MFATRRNASARTLMKAPIGSIQRDCFVFLNFVVLELARLKLLKACGTIWLQLFREAFGATE
jgi:hypothetical protein